MINGYNKYLDIFENYLNKTLPSLTNDTPQILSDGIKYAVADGGKRVRPVLCLAAAECLGVDVKSVLNYALAIELIHSYSLVHDDLPAMDNDDYRRGKLSTHKKFGEANGILIGDALLNLAFETCFLKDELTVNDCKAVKLIGEYSGAKGMIAGQVLDLLNEKSNDLREETLYSIYVNKTAKLITLPLLVASALSGNKYFDEFENFGYNLGVMFQITDDIMDVEGSFDLIGKTPNKDIQSGKFTSIKVFGLDGAKKMAKKHYENCKNILTKIPNADFLNDFTDYMFLRKK